MSSSEQSCPLSPQLPSPDLTAIASMLNEAAQALLNLSSTPEAECSDPCIADDEASISIEDGYECGEFHEEIRCYRLPRRVVKCEYELLCQHKQNNFSSLVSQVYYELFSTILLMRHFDEDTDISGFDLHLISGNLSRPLAVLDSICSQLAEFKLVQKTTVPA